MSSHVIQAANLRRLEHQLLRISDYEKQKLGQDLHDGLSQQISGIKFQTVSLARQLAQGENPQAAQAEQLVRLLTQAEESAHRLARGLHPIRKESTGLMLALEELAVLMNQLYRRACEFRCEEPVLIHQADIAMHLYRIAQEAAGNAMKHGRPTRTIISLHQRRQTVVMEVHDDGRGFATDNREATKNRLGLDIMQYRARLIGARLRIQSHPGTGTTLSCEWRQDAPARSEPASATGHLNLPSALPS